MSTVAERGVRSGRATPMGVIIGRGLLAGLAGGAAMAAFLLLVGERSIRDALALEARHDGGHGDEMFSRGVQVTGGVMAALIYGVLLGAVFAVVHTATRPAGATNAFHRSLGLGAVGYVTVVLVPALKYPANPPGVGDPDTVGLRTASYLTLLGASILLAILARALWIRLRDRGVSEEVRVIVVGGAWLVAIGFALAIWPTNPDDVSVPAQLLWRFRLAALGGAFVLWTVLAVSFGWMSRDHTRGRGISGPDGRDDATDA
jgi:hypothetical protein